MAAPPTSSCQTSKDGNSSRSSRPKQPVRIGQYTLQQTLGTGSFGKVKLATHSLTGHRVAMKIINRRKISSLDMGGRVKREIQYLKLLRHPHIIKLYEVITTPSDIIMVIEYAGGELFQYIVDRGKMPETEARRFFQQIICAIEYCHRHKIVHRDLKPENLLLDEYLNVKIGDFGLSNIMTDGDFLKTSCGSPNYAAPEVISGRLYAGPEIDIWSCGVILYVMLCGRLPFDDEYIPTLFKKINGGIYTLPSHLSQEARHLLSQILVVDPVKRITISDMRSHPWFNVDLPPYLQPLPPTPAVENPEFNFGMTPSPSMVGELFSNDAVSPTSSAGMASSTHSLASAVQSNVVAPDIGPLDDEIIDELADKMVGFDRQSLLKHLEEKGDNQVKVAYQLVHDHKRMVQINHMEDQHGMENFFAQSPPPWNEGLESVIGRSTSIKRKPKMAERIAQRDAPSVPAPPAVAAEESEPWADSDDAFASDDDSPLSDDEHLSEGEEDASSTCGISILETSLPGYLAAREAERLTTPCEERSAPFPIVPAPIPASTAQMHKKPRSRWHFGIRSRSPPMEIMLELYRTLQVLGMEWRTKPPQEGDEHLFFLETRWKVGDVLVRMDLQLYHVDAANYLVDFRNVGYTRLSGHPLDDEDPTTPVKPSLAPQVPAGRKVVNSPFLFLECATRLIVELAGGGG